MSFHSQLPGGSLPYLATWFNLRLIMTIWMGLLLKAQSDPSTKCHFQNELMISLKSGLFDAILYLLPLSIQYFRLENLFTSHLSFNQSLKFC